MQKHYEYNGLARYLPWSPFVEEATTIKENEKYKPIYAGIELYAKAGYTPGYRGFHKNLRPFCSENECGSFEKIDHIPTYKILNSWFFWKQNCA